MAESNWNIVRPVIEVTKYAFLICFVIYWIGCASGKSKIVYSQVESGNQLEQVPEIQLDTFLTIWMHKTEDEKGVSVRQLYKDSTYTYFWARGEKYFKVGDNNLSKLDYQSINGDLILNAFYNEVIPAEHKGKERQCSTALVDFDWAFGFIESENSIIIKCHYKVKCEFLIGVINKDYVAKYDLGSKEIMKL